MKVLVIDDSRTQALMTKIGLERQGCAVVVVQESGEALEVARRERPDVVLSDLNMPDPDGLELCRRLGADPDLAAVPVVLSSASSGDEEARAAAAGARGFIEKGVAPEELVARLAAAVADAGAEAGESPHAPSGER